MYKIHGAKVSMIEYLEQILVTCTSDKYELACLADSHAAQLIWRKENVGRFRRFQPRRKSGLVHAAPGATNLIQNRCVQ